MHIDQVIRRGWRIRLKDSHTLLEFAYAPRKLFPFSQPDGLDVEPGEFYFCDELSSRRDFKITREWLGDHPDQWEVTEHRWMRVNANGQTGLYCLCDPSEAAEFISRNWTANGFQLEQAPDNISAAEIRERNAFVGRIATEDGIDLRLHPKMQALGVTVL